RAALTSGSELKYRAGVDPSPTSSRASGRSKVSYLCPRDMATRTQARSKAAKALTKSDLLDIYRVMLLSRRIDDKEIQLKRQNRIFFQISGAGHEAVLAAAGRVLRPAYDWFYPYYRDRALCLTVGMTPTEMLLAAVAEVQTAGCSVSKLVRNFPDLLVEEVDGCDPVASYEVLLRASEYCRQRKGPALVHAHVTRPYSHSLSDDEVLYKPPTEREEEAKRDSTLTFPQRLIAEGVATAAEIEQIRGQVEEEVGVAADMALASPQPRPETALLYVYSPDVDPTSEQFDTEDDPQFSGDPTTMVDLLNACLKDEMAR